MEYEDSHADIGKRELAGADLGWISCRFPKLPCSSEQNNNKIYAFILRRANQEYVEFTEQEFGAYGDPKLLKEKAFSIHPVVSGYITDEYCRLAKLLGAQEGDLLTITYAIRPEDIGLLSI